MGLNKILNCTMSFIMKYGFKNNVVDRIIFIISKLAMNHMSGWLFIKFWFLKLVNNEPILIKFDIHLNITNKWIIGCVSCRMLIFYIIWDFIESIILFVTLS